MNLALRLFAGIIDFLQFIFFIVLLAFQFITPYGGAAVGGIAGATLCWNASSGMFEGIMNAAACFALGGAAGGLLSAIAAPAGIAIDIAISCTFGFLLILFLWTSGRFSLMAVLIGFSSEALPAVNAFVPGWSLLVHRCIHQYNAAKKEGIPTSRTSPSILMTATKLVPALGGGAAAALARRLPSVVSAGSATKEPSVQGSRVPLRTSNFDGIRPSNSIRTEPYAHSA